MARATRRSPTPRARCGWLLAVIIALGGCFMGFRAEGGAEGVGRSTTSSVVKSIFSVIAADMVFTAIFYYGSES